MAGVDGPFSSLHPGLEHETPVFIEKMSDTRPLKRARQACEPCRRKKSKCPGEKPTCSYCLRLGQQCVYAAGDPEDSPNRQNGQMDERMSNLESKLDQLIQHLNPAAMRAAEAPPLPITAPAVLQTAEPRPTLPLSPQQSQLSVESGRNRYPAVRQPSSIFADSDSFSQIGHIYMTWCHRQPLLLFQGEGFIQTLPTRDRELILALRALCLRVQPGSPSPVQDEQITTMSAASRHVVMERLAKGNVELSTLQTLCILSMVDFSGGRFTHGELNLSIANHLIQNLLASLGDNEASLVEGEEFGNCVQSVMMLRNFHSPIFRTGQPWFAAWPPSDVKRTLSRPAELGAKLEDDILMYVGELSEVWQLARGYALCRTDADTPPPWTAQSDYSRIMQRHLDIDCRTPMKYRWRANRFDKYSPEVLQQQRDYWIPWLYLQFVYTAIPCLLNHPFLLSLRLKHFRHRTPHSFIQQSFEQITRYAGWISHFIDLLEQKDFVLADPVLAHCITIVATIHVQHSFVSDHVLRGKARIEFEKCTRFLRRMGTTWKNVGEMVENLEKLQASATAAVSPGGILGGSPEAPHAGSFDASLLWNLLIYEKSGCPKFDTGTCLFGESLLRVKPKNPEGPPGQDPEAHFDLIGSAGIYGHKTVPKGTPYYPPNEKYTPLGKEDYGPNQPQLWFELENGAMNGTEGQEDLFLFANEYSRAIETWFDLDVQ